MNKGFEIGNSNEVLKADKVYDLHNLYEFMGVVLDTKIRQVRVIFEPISEFGADRTPVSLCFKDVDYLEFSPNFGAQVIDGLDEMGYKSPGDFDDEWLKTEKQAAPEDHLFFRMDGGHFVRIHSKYAEFNEM